MVTANFEHAGGNAHALRCGRLGAVGVALWALWALWAVWVAH